MTKRIYSVLSYGKIPITGILHKEAVTSEIRSDNVEKSGNRSTEAADVL